MHVQHACTLMLYKVRIKGRTKRNKWSYCITMRKLKHKDLRDRCITMHIYCLLYMNDPREIKIYR
jgi:hypothetical protein